MASKKDEAAKMQVDDSAKAASTTTPAPKPAPTPAEEVRANLQLIERAVSTLEPRYTARVLRSLTTLRKKLDAKTLAEVVGGLKDGPVKQGLLPYLPEAPSASSGSMEVDSGPGGATTAKPAPALTEPCPEVD
ncbi:26S proteasome non-ATPase regulatory subunit, partial [Tulasnella sp. 417]